MSERTGYSLVQIGLHWLIALLFAFNYIFGDGMARIFRAHLDGQETALWPGMTHVYVGLTVFWLAILRLVIRWWQGAPSSPPGGPAWMESASVWTHRVMYLLLIAMPWAGGFAWYLNLDIAGEIHVILMNALLVIVGLHAAAALFHQYVLKDGLLWRMLRTER
jgi:cytochrome b561